MDPIVFNSTDAPALRRAARFLRRAELTLPDTAHTRTHQGVLTAAMWLDDQADKLGTAPPQTARETRRHIFNHLVAPMVGGPVFHDQAKAMLDAHEDAIRAAAEETVLRLQGALLALHPMAATPRHGCCAPPQLCHSQRAECRSSEHTIGVEVPWPCRSLRAAGIRTKADAKTVRNALARLDQAADPDGYPGRKKTDRGRGVHATRMTDDGIGDIAACGMYFSQDTESSLEDPGADVSCLACVKALARKERKDAAAAQDTQVCKDHEQRKDSTGGTPTQ